MLGERLNKLLDHRLSVDKVIVNGHDEGIAEVLEGPVVFLVRLEVLVHPSNLKVVPQHVEKGLRKVLLPIWEVTLCQVKNDSVWQVRLPED